MPRQDIGQLVTAWIVHRKKSAWESRG
jgi:hypothetical protein